VIDIHFTSSRDSLPSMTQDAYVELATEADRQLALSLHMRPYGGRCIKGCDFFFSHLFCPDDGSIFIS